MLVELGDRGPDSAGVAIYRDPAAAGWTKLSLYAATEPYDWADLAASSARPSAALPASRCARATAC